MHKASQRCATTAPHNNKKPLNSNRATAPQLDRGAGDDCGHPRCLRSPQSIRHLIRLGPTHAEGQNRDPVGHR